MCFSIRSYKQNTNVWGNSYFFKRFMIHRNILYLRGIGQLQPHLRFFFSKKIDIFITLQVYTSVVTACSVLLATSTWLKAVLPKHYKKVPEIAALPPKVSIQFCLSQPVLPRRLNLVPRSCSWSWCYPVNARGIFTGVVCLEWSLPRLSLDIWMSASFDMSKVHELFCTYSIDDGNMKTVTL